MGKKIVYVVSETYVLLENNSVSTYTYGIYENFKDNPEKYVHACRIHKLLSERHWNYREYINAQFEALSFCNGVPTLDGMYGDKAIERFNKYMYKNHKSQEAEAPVVEGSLWSKINNK